MNMRIVFMGTPEFAVPCLRELIAEKHEIAAVVTQPDRTKGRGNKFVLSPVKILANESGIPVFQPENIKTGESIQLLRNLSPDVIIVVAFGR